QDREQGVQGLLLLLLGRHGQGDIVSSQREREEGGKERHSLCQWQAMLHQEAFQFTQLLLWELLPVEAQRHPLQQINYWIQGAVLIIGRTLARRQPCLRLGSHMFLQHLHETRFANARFAAEKHHLPYTVLDLGPALQKQPYFLFTAHEGRQASAADCFQTAAGHTLIQHLIDLQRLGKASQELSS